MRGRFLMVGLVKGILEWRVRLVEERGDMRFIGFVHLMFIQEVFPFGIRLLTRTHHFLLMIYLRYLHLIQPHHLLLLQNFLIHLRNPLDCIQFLPILNRLQHL